MKQIWQLIKGINMSDKTYYAIVEQCRNDEYRNKYKPETNAFERTTLKSLLFERKFDGVYGWLDGYDYPPNRHLDIMVITKNEYNLGDRIKIKIIGIFKRNDNDNKLIAVEYGRNENEINELSESDQIMIKRLYPIIKNGEGWLGKEVAEKSIDAYIK